jgi:hypothetical protein
MIKFTDLERRLITAMLETHKEKHILNKRLTDTIGSDTLVSIDLNDDENFYGILNPLDEDYFYDKLYEYTTDGISVDEMIDYIEDNYNRACAVKVDE